MRIAIDAAALLLRSAGVKSYVYHWVRSLRRLAGRQAILTFPVNLSLGELYHEGSMANLPLTIAGLCRLHLMNYSPGFVRDSLSPRVDVFHASQQLWSPPRLAVLTATLYDLTCWLMPEAHTKANVAAARRFAEGAWRRARRLIAISQSTRADAVRLLGLPAERIEVIYPGVAESFFEVPPERVQQVRACYALARPYVLSVGTIEPRKNLDALLDAWAQLASSTRDEFELIVAGPPGWGDGAILARLRAGAPGVRYLGYVPESDLPALTAGATVLAYPSLYEGFGLPAAQAMAAGVPVLTSAVSSLPEVVGDAGLLVDPRSTSEIRAGLERLLGSPTLRRDLAARAVLRAQAFHWERCARESWRFFQEAAEG